MILFAFKLGILSAFNVPAVILFAFKLGIRSTPNVPALILLAFKFGILSAFNVPAVILLAFKFGILAASMVPETTLDPSILPLKLPTLNVLVLGLYDKLSSIARAFPDPSLSVNVK